MTRDTVQVVETAGPVPLTNATGTFQMYGFRISSATEVQEHFALVVGEPEQGLLVRVNSACINSEVFGCSRCDCAWQLWQAMDRMQSRGAGIVTYHPSEEGRGSGLFRKVQSFELMDEHGYSSARAFAALGLDPDQRSFRPAASILRHFGITTVSLLTNNPQKVSAIEQAGIAVVRTEPLLPPQANHWGAYLEMKAVDFGHHIFPGNVAGSVNGA